MSTPPEHHKRLATTAAGIVLLHIAACVFCIVMPHSYLANTYPGRLYQKMFLVGPFYPDDRIRITPQAYISVYTAADGWHPARYYGHEHYQAFHRQPWRYDKLKRSDFERHLFRKVAPAMRQANAGTLLHAEQFHRVSAYVQKELLAGATPDSIRIVYVLNTWQPAHNTLVADTLADVRYNPNTLPHAE